MSLLQSSAFGAALVFGFRHGFDWDHLAALTDLTGSQTRPRRALALATLYVLGHAAMILVLGSAAIMFAAEVPAGLDEAMGRLVGVSLIALGLWIAWTTIRSGGAPPVRSRWMLLIEAIGRGVRRARAGRGGAVPVVIEHAHPHGHDHPLHDHAHPHRDLREDPLGKDPARQQPAPVAVATGHSHLHRHVVPPVDDPFLAYGSWSSFGIGLLHGVGAETPTQVLVFAAATRATDTASGLGVLACFVVGLMAANTLVALAGTFGFRHALRSRAVLMVLAVVTAAASITVGVLTLAGRGDLLPALT